MDFLGFKALTDAYAKSGFPPEYLLQQRNLVLNLPEKSPDIASAFKHILTHDQKYAGTVGYLSASDCCCFYTDDDSPTSLVSIVLAASSLFWYSMVHHKWPMRGAICAGEFAVDPNDKTNFVGGAYTNAVDLEKIQDWAGILMDATIISDSAYTEGVEVLKRNRCIVEYPVLIKGSGLINSWAVSGWAKINSNPGDNTTIEAIKTWLSDHGVAHHIEEKPEHIIRKERTTAFANFVRSNMDVDEFLRIVTEARYVSDLDHDAGNKALSTFLNQLYKKQDRTVHLLNSGNLVSKRVHEELAAFYSI